MTSGVTGRRAGLVSVLATVFILTGFAAEAYWTRGGGGAGSGATGTSEKVTLTPAAATSEVYPGGNGTVRLTVTNANPAPVRFGSLTLDTTQGTGGFAVDAGHGGCPVQSVLSMSAQTNGGVGWTVPGASGGTPGTLAVTLANSLVMVVDADNACQGAAFTVYLAAGT